MESLDNTLWKRWHEGREIVARDALILAYAPWARTVARDVFMRVRFMGDAWHDCVQNALIGLMEALDRFEPERGVAFQTYARYRVRGAVFNGLRNLRESMAQSAHSHEQTQAVRDRLESFEDDGLDSLESFVASTVGLGLGFILEAASFPGLSGQPDAYAELEKDQLRRAIVNQLPSLGEREQMIVIMHYYHHISFVEIASQLGVTKGRISQLHKRALEHLRCKLCDCPAKEY